MLVIDHVNIRSRAVDALRDFYVHVFDLVAEAIPGAARGYWLSYDQEKPALIHLVSSDTASLPHSPQIEHVGFRAVGLRTRLARLESLDHPHAVATHPHLDLVRLNFRDPDGNRVHVDFPLCEDKSEADVSATEVS